MYKHPSNACFHRSTPVVKAQSEVSFHWRGARTSPKAGRHFETDHLGRRLSIDLNLFVDVVTLQEGGLDIHCSQAPSLDASVDDKQVFGQP